VSAKRLNQWLALAGVGSRRHCDGLIQGGRVLVEGQVVHEPGFRVEDGQEVRVDGQPVKTEELVYWAVHKPRGILCTNHDPSGRPRVIDLLPHIPQRVYTVGRLDADSEGLLLMTNDGPMALRLTHPRYEVEKTYRVQVAGNPGSKDLEKLLEGVYLAEGRVRAKSVDRLKSQGESTWLRIVLAEGKNREIRRMLAQLGHKVLRLIRLQIGPLFLDRLPAGKSRRLSLDEITRLRKLCTKVQARREALIEGTEYQEEDVEESMNEEVLNESPRRPRSSQGGGPRGEGGPASRRFDREGRPPRPGQPGRFDRPMRAGPGGPPRGRDGDRPMRAGPGGPPRGRDGDRPMRAGPGGPPRGRDGDRPMRAGPGGPPRGRDGDRPMRAGPGGPPRGRDGDRPMRAGPGGPPRGKGPGRPDRPGTLRFTPRPARPGDTRTPRAKMPGGIPKANTPLPSGYKPPVRPARKPNWRKKPGEDE
jgi:23S rRNA pseudouridine2605 synthase